VTGPGDDLSYSVGQINRERVLAIGFMPRETDSELLREGIARCNIANTGGVCPCGARWTPPNRAARRAAASAGTLLYVVVVHEADCPGADDVVRKLLRNRSGR